MIPGAFPIVGGGAFNPQAVNFDGATYLSNTSGFSNVSDGNAGTLSYWFKPAAIGAQQTIIASGPAGGNPRFFSTVSTTGLVTVRGNATNDTQWLQANSSSTLSAGVWYHVIVSWLIAGSTPTWRVYINDTADANGGGGSGTIDYTQARWYVGADVFNNARFLNGDFAELFFIPQSIDLTVTANRRKFISATGGPVSLGNDGSVPFGAVPTVHLSGDATRFGTNRGNGGALTLAAGALTTATTRPHL